MHTSRTSLPRPQYYSLFATCHAHGWKDLAPFHWCNERAVLRFALSVSKHSVDVEIREDGGSIIVTFLAHERISSRTRQQAVSAIRRSIGLDVDTRRLLAVARTVGHGYERLIRDGAGRMLRGTSLWEDAAKTLFTTNCSWALTKRMTESICSSDFVCATPSGAHPFPSPDTLCHFSTAELRSALPVGYRAEYLSRLCQQFAQDPSLGGLEGDGLTYEQAYIKATSLRGFGPYAAKHLLLTAGYFEAIPIDCEVTKYMRSNYGTEDVARLVRKQYDQWGEFQWWGFKLERMMKRQNWIGD